MVVSNNKGRLINLAPKNETAIQARALGKKTIYNYMMYTNRIVQENCNI